MSNAGRKPCILPSIPSDLVGSRTGIDTFVVFRLLSVKLDDAESAVKRLMRANTTFAQASSSTFLHEHAGRGALPRRVLALKLPLVCLASAGHGKAIEDNLDDSRATR